jgi:hypothetical protein
VSEAAEKDKWWTPVKLGVLLSGLVLGLFLVMAFWTRCELLPSQAIECRKNLEWFFDSPPNEIGDTLAGFAGVLAFVWIIVTVALQSHELREQRKELSLTREELMLARLAQEKQLESMQIQAEIFKDEKLSRDQIRAFSEVEALVKEIDRTAKSSAIASACWIFQVEDIHTSDMARSHELVADQYTYIHNSDVSKTAQALSEHLSVAQSMVFHLMKKDWTLTQSPKLSEELNKLREMIERINTIYPELSSADQIRTRSFGLDVLLDRIEEIQDLPSYWDIWG